MSKGFGQVEREKGKKLKSEATPFLSSIPRHYKPPGAGAVGLQLPPGTAGELPCVGLQHHVSLCPSVHLSVSTASGRFHLPFTEGQDFSCEHGQRKATLPLVYHKFGQATGKIFRSLGGTQSGWKQYWPLYAQSPNAFFVKSKKNGCLLTGKLRTEKVINSIVCRK